jgi:hypothetical protein
MAPAMTADLERLHKAVVSSPESAPEQALIVIEEFGELLGAANLPATHTYWNHYYYYKLKRLFEQRRLSEGLRLAYEATLRNPGYAGAWHYKGIFENELERSLAAFHSLKTAWRLRDDPNIMSRMVQILFARKRYRIAAKLGRRLFAGGLSTRSFRFLMAQIELQMHDADAALSHLDAFESIGKATEYVRSVRRMAETLRAHQLRHVAIAGMSYVGSTLMGTLLGSLPGCAHAGETQELIYRADPKAYEFPVIDFDRDPPEAIPQCRVCGAACPVFTREFRAELARDRVDWYFRIGRRLGARIVISSDKFLSEYLFKDPLSRFDLIVLYKPLQSWVYSHLREEAYRASIGVVSSPAAFDLVRILNQWAHNYYGFLKDLRPQGRRLVVNWEQFAERPIEHFELMIEKLRLAGDASVFENVHAAHYVGGNDGIRPVLEAGRVSFRPSRAGALNPEDRAIVARHDAAQAVLRMLDHCYAHDFRELSHPRRQAC